jgi:methionyl-tRNA formyltransferase
MDKLEGKMKIIVLGPRFSSITSFLNQKGYSVIECSDPVDRFFLLNNDIDFAVSYRYRHIISQEAITCLKGKIINLHISYLPWNRGADPNLWSFLEDTPKGVSIHYVDTGIDTGDLIARKKIVFNEIYETLSTSYETLNDEILSLFRASWDSIVNGEAQRIKQSKGGSLHKSKDKEPYLHLLAQKGYDTPVLEIKGKALAGKGKDSQKNFTG